MTDSPAKKEIMRNIRKALTSTTPIPFPAVEGNVNVFAPSQNELEIEFAEQFRNVNGKFAYCVSAADTLVQIQKLIEQQQWKKIYFSKQETTIDFVAKSPMQNLFHNDLAECDVSISTCECLVARTGTIVLSSALPSGRTASVYAPVHICIGYTTQLVYDLKDAFQLLKEKYGQDFPSYVCFATGPSRTADIEKTLVVGVHGPKEVYCFLMEDF